MPYQLGSTTESTFLKLESHKLFHEFEVATGATVYKGQPVYISGDGEVTPLGTSGTTQQCIGISMHDGEAGDLVTVMMKAFAIIWAECETDALAAGPVRIGTSAVYNATTGYVLIDDATVGATNQIGWAIEGGDDGDLVRVAIL